MCLDSAVLLAEEPPREVLQGAEAAPDDILPDSQLPTLRKRRKHRKLKPYIIDSCDEDAGSSSDSSCPPTPPAHDDYFSHSYDADQEVSYEVTEDGAKYTIVRHQNTHEPCVPSILPQYAADKPEDERELSLVEAFVDLFAPYREMSHPQCDYGKVLSRLLTEWYAIGASLLATATCVLFYLVPVSMLIRQTCDRLNAAVYGYSAGTLFDVDGLALRSVTLGSIASGIGLVADVWFLVVYSGADVAKFQVRPSPPPPPCPVPTLTPHAAPRARRLPHALLLLPHLPPAHALPLRRRLRAARLPPRRRVVRVVRRGPRHVLRRRRAPHAPVPRLRRPPHAQPRRLGRVARRARRAPRVCPRAGPGAGAGACRGVWGC